MVVHDVGKVVCGQLVSALIEHLVVQNVALYLDVAADHIVHVHLYSGLHLEAYHILFAVGDAALHLLLRKSERVGHLLTCTCVVLEVLHSSTLGFELFGRIEGDVSLVVSKELVNVLLVYGATLALTVRTVIAAEAHTLVKLDAEPAERFDDIFLCSGNEAVRVGVLNAEHQVSAVLAGEKIVIQCCTHTTDVQRSGRTRCEAHPYFSL